MHSLKAAIVNKEQKKLKAKTTEIPVPNSLSASNS